MICRKRKGLPMRRARRRIAMSPVTTREKGKNTRKARRKRRKVKRKRRNTSEAATTVRNVKKNL